MTMEMTHVFTLEGEKIARLEAYFRGDEAPGAAGLRK